jgi:hypothetical protein
MSRVITETIINLIITRASKSNFICNVGSIQYMKTLNNIDLLDILYHAAVYSHYSVYEVINHGYINRVLYKAFENIHEITMQNVVRDVCHQFWPDEY